MRANRTTTFARKIFAFFGSDLTRGSADFTLARSHKEGYTLLALDSDAMSAAVSVGVPFAVLEDLLSVEDFCEAQVQADESGRNWFEAARDDFTVDGFCWPELEMGTMRYSWGNATLALKLVKALQKAGTQEFKFVCHFSPRPHLGTGKSDLCAALWKAEMPGVARPIIGFEELRLARMSSLAKRALGRLRRGDGRQALEGSPPLKPPIGGIFLVMGGAEALRFSELVQELSSCFPGRVAVATTGLSTSDTGSLPWRECIPVVQGPPPAVESWMPPIAIRWLSRRTKELSARFMRGYIKSRDCAVGRPWQRALETLRFHFAYYCQYRWPRLHTGNAKFWSDFWESQRPRAVFSSAVEDGRFRLVVATAKAKGIRTIGVPHGGMVGTPGYCVTPVVDELLYSTKLQKAAFERSGFPDSHMHACRGLVAPNEYPVMRTQAFSARGRLRVLALTDTTDEGTNLVKLVGLRAQFTALNALVAPPDDLVNRVELRVKTHPKFRDMGMIRAVGPALLDKLMPAESDLHTALEESDVVVAINYYGSALIHAFRAGLPVIQFLTVHESLANSSLNLFNLYSQGGAIARSETEFWGIVRSLLADTGAVRKLRQQALEFARERLDDSSFPSISVKASDLGLMD